MAIYYFHVRDGADFARDDAGIDYPNAIAALADIKDMARDLAIEDLRRGLAVGDRVIQVTDDIGSPVGEMRIRTVLTGNPFDDGSLHPA